MAFHNFYFEEPPPSPNRASRTEFSNNTISKKLKNISKQFWYTDLRKWSLSDYYIKSTTQPTIAQTSEHKHEIYANWHDHMTKTHMPTVPHKPMVETASSRLCRQLINYHTRPPEMVMQKADTLPSLTSHLGNELITTLEDDFL